jgi:hypothetical protein
MMVKKQPNYYAVEYHSKEGLDRTANVNAYSAPLAVKAVKAHFKVDHINSVKKK